jgi:hypothetical protein
MGKAARKANREKRKAEQEAKLDDALLEALDKHFEKIQTDQNSNIVQTGNQTFAGAGSAEGIGS